jgi:hypothetical protein
LKLQEIIHINSKETRIMKIAAYTKDDVYITNQSHSKNFLDISKFLKSDVILFSGVLDKNTWCYFFGIIPKRKKLTILLRGNGGEFYHPYIKKTLDQYLRSIGYKTINTIILDYAKSSLTVLALSSDNLKFYDLKSGLSAIDPRDIEEEKSGFFTFIKPKEIEFDGKVFSHKSNRMLNTSNASNFIFTLQYTFNSLKKGKILSKNKFCIQYKTLLGLNPKSGIKYSNDHSVTYGIKKWNEIGLKVDIINPKLKSMIKIIYDELFKNILKGKEDNRDYYVFENDDVIIKNWE